MIPNIKKNDTVEYKTPNILLQRTWYVLIFLITI